MEVAARELVPALAQRDDVRLTRSSTGAPGRLGDARRRPSVRRRSARNGVQWVRGEQRAAARSRGRAGVRARAQPRLDGAGARRASRA